MKPTGATKEATVSEQAIEVIKDCSNWSDIRYRILPRVEALINERELLREIAKDALRFREEVNGKCSHDEAMTKLCTQCEIRAALNDTTPSTSAGGG